MNAAHDPLYKAWKARTERANAIQKEQSNEAFAGKWIRVDAVEEVLVPLAGLCQGILSGMLDAARAEGASQELCDKFEVIIRDANLQIANQLSPAAISAIEAVEQFESGADDLPDEDAEIPVTGPKERKARLRKPRGVGKMGRDK